MARLQTAGISEAIAVSTLAEASVFASNGFTDITYAVPIEPGKFTEVIRLAKKCERLSLITDSVTIPALLNDAARQAGVTLSVFLEVDCGYGRCGLRPDVPEAMQIPRQITDSSNLHFAGILTQAGQSYHARSQEEVLVIARHERDLMKECAVELRKAGVDVATISIGSTPTITAVDHLDGIDEARPGNYIFF